VGELLDTLRRERVVVVIRGAEVATIEREVSALYEGGLRIFEITMEAPEALDALASLRRALPKDAVLGAGTVFTPATASNAMEAGASFVVSPVLRRDVAQLVLSRGVPCLLGGMTPTEIYEAHELGCEAVKVFPASAVGSGFFREMRGPLGFVPFYPTGGITLGNAKDYLDAGAVALGVGGALVKREWVASGHWDALRDEARQWAALRRA
jgi:2-dehydro-3-deoxyphosphogluconate aldolase / (4S)-4-hydroxy-2-oxoglutarate aldolase